MNKTLWALQMLLALAFAAAGTTKLLTPRAQLVANPNMAWAEDFSDVQIKLIGAAEVAGAIGLVAPMAAGLLPVLTPVAGAGLALLMGGAASTHLTRGEPPYAPLVLGALAAAVAAGRWRTTRRRA
jgi:DoxX-like family